MDSREVIGRLRKDSWVLRNVKGSHHHFTHPRHPGVVTVPHPHKDIPVGTLRSVFRQAGWDWRSRR